MHRFPLSARLMVIVCAITLFVVPAAAQSSRTRTPQPTPSPTIIATRTPLPTAMPVVDGIIPAQPVTLYAAPFEQSEIIGELPADELIEPDAVSADGVWIGIDQLFGASGWFIFNVRTMRITGSLADLPVIDIQPTATAIPPTETPLPTTTFTPLPTATPIPPTETPLPTATFTPLPTATPVPPTETPLPTATLIPPTATPTPTPTTTSTPTVAAAPVAQAPAQVRTMCAANSARVVALPPGGQELWVRDAANGRNVVIRLANNNPITPLGVFRFANGQWWCQIRVNLTGQTGWVESGLMR